MSINKQEKNALWTIAWNIKHRDLAAALTGVHELLNYHPGDIATPVPLAFDERTERNLGTLLGGVVEAEFRKLVRIAAKVAAGHGCEARVISGTRTYAQQDRLYAKGRTAAGPKVTNARGGYSNHNFGIAADLGLFQGSKYLGNANPRISEQIHQQIGAAAKSARLNLEWGGDWRSIIDLPHWQFATGLTTAQMRKRVAAGQAVV